MTDEQADPQFVSQVLQRDFPKPRTMAVAAAAVRRDQQLSCMRKTLSPISFYQRRMLLTANFAVSWSIPTLTHPWFCSRSYTPYRVAFPSI